VSGVNQAVARLHEVDGTETCTVTLSTAQAFSVGLTLRMMARNAKMPAETREQYRAVGEQLEAAAKVSLRRRR
jgi:hypothetical protein